MKSSSRPCASQPCERRVRQRGVLERADVADVALAGREQRLAGERAATLARPPPTPDGRCRDDTRDHVVLDHQRDERRPDRDSADEVLGAVDRVDHPAARSPAGRALLLAVERVARTGSAERAAHGLLDGLVGVGDRGQVGLVDDVQVLSLEPVHRQRVRVVGEDVRESQIVGVVRRHSAQRTARTG